MTNELLALNRIRLEEDLSYERLGEEVGVQWQTLYRLLTTPNPRLHDRTLFKIQRFLSTRSKKGAAA